MAEKALFIVLKHQAIANILLLLKAHILMEARRRTLPLSAIVTHPASLAKDQPTEHTRLSSGRFVPLLPIHSRISIPVFHQTSFSSD